MLVLPKLGPHTWRVDSPNGIRFTAMLRPSGTNASSTISAVAADVGAGVLGSPPSDEEVRQITAQAENCDLFIAAPTLPCLDSEKGTAGER
jgi:hypothetical protein